MSDEREWPPEDEEPSESGELEAGDDEVFEPEDALEETYEDRVAAPEDVLDAPPDDWADETDEVDSAIDDVEISSAIPYMPEDSEDAESGAESTAAGEPSELGEGERLRQPRAQSFRRRLANQISMLPLALYLLAMGGYLIADKQNVNGLPDLDAPALIGGLVLAVAASMMLHSLVFGRRERGLLFVGLTVWVTASAVGLLVASMEETPEPGEWWPILLIALGVSLLLTYLIERVHDGRLVLLSLFMFVASGVAFWTTLGNTDLDRLDNAADYWPLLLAVLGIGLLPLAFRRRTG
ncbi:MAG TPA: hypothetical protein PKD09_15610 [Aggregatilinea sp.]|uniref:hypothetical protein n=1 Tax=Aggregatilinea sp. TaxID=2806333 RepID=UPI002B6B58CA|nr:hypothetical protein [Aggregatilinea sp.]HML23080.1 hypothetical protein [Aggregatilinea sp.]